MPRPYQLAIWILFAGVLLGGMGCRRLTDAERRARAEVEIYVDVDLPAPKFHEPIGTWRALHSHAIKKGERSRYQCVLCHDPPRHCTKCHRQAGVRDAIDRDVLIETLQTDLDTQAATRRTGAPLVTVPAAKRTADRSPRARPDVRGASRPRAGKQAELSLITTKHVERMVQRLAQQGQRMREDRLACLGKGNGLCLPCHTMSPSTARSLKPIHITMIGGMEAGLTSSAPKDIRRPLCTDCHAYPLTDENVLAGDLKFDMLRKPCVQRECHTDRDFKWALTFVGHMKQAIKHVPDDELFASGELSRNAIKRTGVVVSWVLAIAALAAVCFVRWPTERGGGATNG